MVSNTLREFIPAAAELARQQGLQQAGPRAQMGMIRTALRMARQVPIPLHMPLLPAAYVVI